MTASGLRTFVLLAAPSAPGADVPPQQASQAPPSPASPPRQTASQPATKAAADTKSPDAQPTKTAAAQNSDSDAQLIKDARSAGFKPMQVRGSLMYCRTAVELGSSFPVRTCYNAQQVKIKIHEYQTQRNQLEQMHNIGTWSN